MTKGFYTENELDLAYIDMPVQKFKLKRHYFDDRGSHDLMFRFDTYDEAERMGIELDCEEYVHDIEPADLKVRKITG